MIQFLLSEVWPYIAMVVGAAVAVLVSWKTGKKRGAEQQRTRQETDALKMKVEAANRGREIDEEISKLDDADLRQRGSKWVRDDHT